MVSLAISAWIAALGVFTASLLPTYEVIMHVVNFVAPFCMITILFSAIYKVLPDTRIEWKDVALGGAVTSLLFSNRKKTVLSASPAWRWPWRRCGTGEEALKPDSSFRIERKRELSVFARNQPHLSLCRVCRCFERKGLFRAARRRSAGSRSMAYAGNMSCLSCGALRMARAASFRCASAILSGIRAIH